MTYRISYTYLHQALACSYQSFLRYEGHLETPQTHYLALGNSLHLVLEKLYGEPPYAPVLSLQEAIQMFLDEFNRDITENEIFASYPQLVKARKDGADMLATYFAQMERGELRNPIAVEQMFKLPIAGAEIVGKIDKVEQDDDGELIVIDYKSGATKPKEWFLRRSLQFTCYAYACEQLYGKFPKEVVWHHLKSGELLRSTRDEWDIEQLTRTIESVVKMRDLEIRYRSYHEKVCEWCPFSGIGGACDDPNLEQQILDRRENEKQIRIIQ
jgi:RecB family exonuclease